MKKNDKPVRVERLAGDASVRIFSRLFFDDGSTAVEMITPETHRQDYGKYLLTQAFLKKHNVSVPEIIETDEQYLKIIIEDLGSADYFSIHPKLPEKERADFYAKFTSEALKIGSLAPAFERDYTGTKETLGFERLAWEMNFFLENYFSLYPDKKPSERDFNILKDFLINLAKEVSSFPVVLCHRDYHSKNIMMTPDGFRIIDFQDLRLGPYNYDLASLLWDSYVTPSSDIISAMERRFFADLPRLGINISIEEFERQNRITALQRNIKAVGTFANQALKGKTVYLPFIFPTFEKAFDHLRMTQSSRKIKIIFNTFITK